MEATMKTKCEIYSRIVGYLRPISNWNEGKIEEFHDRILFKTENEQSPTERISNNIKDKKETN